MLSFRRMMKNDVTIEDEDMGRLTNNDKYLGPITYGRTSWNSLRLVWSSGGDGDDDATRNTLTAYAFGWIVRVNLPNMLQPFRVKHFAPSWDAATVARLGRNWYLETFSREYGFSLSEGFFQVFLGAQTHDSETTQSWSTFLPWTQWRFVRYSLYDLNGMNFWTNQRGFHKWEEQQRMCEAVPKAAFEFDDYDGKRIIATTHIEEREWMFGEGWFMWLSIFRPNKVSRGLDIRFSEEVGPEKGSWKGGTLGHSRAMLPGELHEAAFRRYCEQEHTSKNGTFRIKFVGGV